MARQNNKKKEESKNDGEHPIMKEINEELKEKFGDIYNIDFDMLTLLHYYCALRKYYFEENTPQYVFWEYLEKKYRKIKMTILNTAKDAAIQCYGEEAVKNGTLIVSIT